MARMQTLSAQDASFLHMEDAGQQLHIGSVAVFEGPAPSYADFTAHVRSKLHLVPRYRQKLRFVPFELGRPVWVDDPHFQLEFHLRHTALPAPGDDDQLRAMAGRVMGQVLDRTKALWEMWLVEGLTGDRWALVSKVHHCMVDGVSGAELLSVLLDLDRDAPPTEAALLPVAPEPSDVEVLLHALREPWIPGRAAAELRRALRHPRETLLSTALSARALLATQDWMRLRETSLTGQVGPHRRYAWAETDLADVQTIRRAHEVTVNDVVLAAVTHGFRRLLAGRGEDLADRTVRTMVPVSVRAAHERGTYNNRVSAVFVDLPVGLADPVEVLRDVHGQMADIKRTKKALAGEAITSMQGFAPPMLLALGTRRAARSGQTTFETTATNVPGPQVPLYAVGRRMLASYPYVPIAGAVRVATAIFSYDGRLTFGVTGDYDHVPDIATLSSGITDGLAELLARSSAPSRNGKAPSGRRPKTIEPVPGPSR